MKLLWATIRRCSKKEATRAKASRRDRQEVNTTACNGDACDGVGGGVAGRDADGGGVVPLRLSMTMHTTDV